MDNTGLLNSEKSVLIINNFTALKIVYVNEKNEYIEEEYQVDEKNTMNILNLLGACWKSKIMPIKGDFLDNINDRFKVKRRFFEIKENDVLFIVFEICT